jgi:radical SAM protein with 4Fe4S-binding SPASM domain
MELSPFIPLKLLKHNDRIEQMLAGEVVYPISVEIDLANICNHGCPWCSFNGFRQENWVKLPTGRGLELLWELAAVGVKSITFTGGGEPLVHQDAAQFFRCARIAELEYGVVTNGRRLEGPMAEEIAKGATFVRVSLDAGTTQTHQLLHATATPEYDRILANMAQMRDKAAGLTIGASFCVFDSNLHEIGEAARRVKAMGANYLEVRPVFATEWRGGGFSNPLTREHVERARTHLQDAKDAHDGDGFRVIGMISRFDQVCDQSKAYSQCRIGPLTTVINADGNLYHCCQQRGMKDFIVGNILAQSFEEAWQHARERQMHEWIDVGKCPPCRYDGYNRILEDACIGDALHANFI